MSTEPVSDNSIRPARETRRSCQRRRVRFACLRHVLLAHGVAHLRMVYFASADECIVTLVGTPVEGRIAPLDLPEGLRARLLKLFRAWMHTAHPDWTHGPDAGGVLDWDVRESTFAHRHSGYRVQLVSFHRRT